MRNDRLLRFRRTLRQEAGQDLSEYVVLVALIAVLIIAALVVFSDGLDAYWQKVIADLTAALT
jgi:Flp pilus assembly pilin Flp